MGGCGSKPKTLEDDVPEVPQTETTSEVTAVVADNSTNEAVPESAVDVAEGKPEVNESTGGGESAVVAEEITTEESEEKVAAAEEKKDEQDKMAEPEKTEEKTQDN